MPRVCQLGGRQAAESETMKPSARSSGLVKMHWGNQRPGGWLSSGSPHPCRQALGQPAESLPPSPAPPGCACGAQLGATAPADIVADLGLPDRDVLAVLHGVAGQGDRKLHAFRAALLDELELPFGDVDGSAAVCDRRQAQARATATTAAETRQVQSPTISTCSPRHFTWPGDPPRERHRIPPSCWQVARSRTPPPPGDPGRLR